MAMTLRPSETLSQALRDRSAYEQRSQQEIVLQAVEEYLERHGRRDLLDSVLDRELPRYAEALRRLGE